MSGAPRGCAAFISRNVKPASRNTKILDPQAACVLATNPA
jgi:hypothetical protein